MDFKVDINVAESKTKIEYYHSVIFLGSCFATNMSDKFQACGLSSMNNPFGVLYNPVSILKSLEIVEDRRELKKEDLFFHNELWQSFSFHSDFSQHSPEAALEKMNHAVIDFRDFITSTDYIFITYGTSFVFKHKESGEIVSNCHKIPQKEFSRYTLSYEDTVEILRKTIETLRRLNNNIKIVFTLSPVRYWPKEAVENQLAKATLLLAIHRMIDGKYIDYFPAYEIMMDDLRDYRFYKEDFIHPNKMAIDYIWQRFYDSFLSAECRQILDKVVKIKQAREHRPRNVNSPLYRDFIKKQIGQIEKLRSDYSYVTLQSDYDYFRGKIVE